MRSFKNLSLTAALISISVSAYAADPCAAIKAMAADKSMALQLAAAVNDPNPEIQSCAIRAAGESKNELAAEALLANVSEYQADSLRRGPFEDNLKARLKAIDSIWSLGEIGNPKVMSRLMKMYKGSDSTLKINIAIGAGKTASKGSEEFLYGIAANPQEDNVVRAAAYEMLGDRRGPAPDLSARNGMEKGDIIFTGGVFGIPQDWIGDLPIGHVGLYGGTEVKDGKIVVVIYDCVPDNFKPYGGVRKIFSFTNFTHQNHYAFYGNRVPRKRPTAAQRDLIIKAAVSKLGHHYADAHFSQKGPDIFDCVGYAEYAYEAAGLNPTPNDQETGWGWPLTPAEQFAATFPNSRAEQAPASNSAIIVPPQQIIVPQQAIITQNAGALLNAFGMQAQALPEVNMNIGFKAAN